MAFSKDKSIELGNLVMKAYDAFEAKKPPVLDAQYQLITEIYADDFFDDLPDYVRYGFIARSGADLIIAIRGTQGILEWIRNIDFPLTNSPIPGTGQTEAGFATTYQSLRTGPADDQPLVADKIIELIKATPGRVWVTGHSLGGALATILSLDLAKQGIKSLGAYTFASPRTGDADFATAYNSAVTASWRIVNKYDVVPELPDGGGYTHVNTEFPIDSKGVLSIDIFDRHSLTVYLATLAQLP